MTEWSTDLEMENHLPVEEYNILGEYTDNIHAKVLTELIQIHGREICHFCPANVYVNKYGYKPKHRDYVLSNDACRVCETFIQRKLWQQEIRPNPATLPCPCSRFGREKAISLTQQALEQAFPEILNQNQKED